MRAENRDTELFTIYPAKNAPSGTPCPAAGEKKKVLLVYTNLGIGGIVRSLIEFLRVPDREKYEITLYIRRDDVLDLLDGIPDGVGVVTVKNDVKGIVFEPGIRGRIAQAVYGFLRKRHAWAAKKFFERYKRPIQRRREKAELEKRGLRWDTAVSYSTDGDDPVFVRDCVDARRKYVFIHQSTALAPQNVKAMRAFDGVFVVNPTLIPWAEKMTGGKTAVSAIENYVDADKVRRLSAEETVQTPAGRHVFATCGRICPTKGFDFVVGAASILKEKGVPFLWYWVGDGPDRVAMEAMIAEKNLKDEIVITGFLSNPFPYVDACDIYVQPSRAEAYPLSVIEALILRKPVVASRTAGPEYIFKKYGCGFPVDASAEELATELLRLTSQPDLLQAEQRRVLEIDWAEEREQYIRRVNALLDP